EDTKKAPTGEEGKWRTGLPKDVYRLRASWPPLSSILHLLGFLGGFVSWSCDIPFPFPSHRRLSAFICGSFPPPYQPHLRDLAAAAVPAETGFARPAERERAALCQLVRQLELNRLRRPRLLEERVDLDAVVRLEPDAPERTVAGIDDAEGILRLGIEVGVA